MKKIVLLLSFVLCLAAVGRSQTVRNANNSFIAKMESNGTIRDGNNSMLARIQSDGVIRDPNNRYLGKVESDGTVRDRNNSALGRWKATAGSAIRTIPRWAGSIPTAPCGTRTTTRSAMPGTSRHVTPPSFSSSTSSDNRSSTKKRDANASLFL